MVWNFLKGGSGRRPARSELGAFGKIPSMGDFVRVGSKPLASFESWLESGHGARRGEAQGPLARRSTRSRSGRTASSFAVSPRRARKTTGDERHHRARVFDSVGRRFPLVIFSAVQREARGQRGLRWLRSSSADFLADALHRLRARRRTTLPSGDALKERSRPASRSPTFDQRADLQRRVQPVDALDHRCGASGSRSTVTPTPTRRSPSCALDPRVGRAIFTVARTPPRSSPCAFRSAAGGR